MRWLAVCSFLVACGSSTPPPGPPAAPLAQPDAKREAPRSTPDAPFRQQAPSPEGKVTFVAPNIHSTKLKNGIPVYFAERRDLPIVSVQIVARGGGDELAAPSGVAGLLGSMFETGTKTRSALAISDRFQEIGAHHGSWVGWSSSGVGATVATEQLPQAMELVADLALSPAFPADELERIRARRLAGLVQERSSPSIAFSNVANMALYGSKHAYGAPLGGFEEDVKRIQRADLLRAYKQLFAKGRLGIIVAGQIEEASVLALLEKHFGGLKGAAQKAKTPANPALPKRAIAFVDKPGAQSQIGIVGLGADARAADRFAIAVMNAILGGAFSSRVNLNLREKHAYTYGARSWFEQRAGLGPFMLRAAVVADKTIPALNELLAEVKRMRESDVSEDELRMAKDYLKLSLPARFETTEDLARAASELFLYDFPANDFATRAERYEAVTVADVRKVATEYLDAKRWRVVVVGDAALRGELEKLDLGPVEPYEASGRPVGR